MSNLTLDQLAGRPTLEMEIGGRRFAFSELPVDSLARLQETINAIIPHPVRALAGHLDGLPPGDRETLLNRAYRDALGWPPVVGTAAGAGALLGSEPGQVAAIHEGLLVHQPGTTRGQAVWVYRKLRWEAEKERAEATRRGELHDGEGKARRIFACLFGLDEPGDDFPKG